MRAMIVPAAMSLRATHAIAAIEDLPLLRRQRVIERFQRRLFCRQIGQAVLQHLLHARLTLENAVPVHAAHMGLTREARAFARLGRAQHRLFPAVEQRALRIVERKLRFDIGDAADIVRITVGTHLLVPIGGIEIPRPGPLRAIGASTCVAAPTANNALLTQALIRVLRKGITFICELHLKDKAVARA